MLYLKHLQAMARYNQWMNEKLAAVYTRIPDADRRRDMGAFFKSIHGTLNHLLLADRIWMGRFKAQPFAATALTAELYSDFEELIRERALTDREILDYVAVLDEEFLAQNLTYTPMSSKQEKSLPRWLTLATFSTTKPTIAARSQL